MKNFLSTSISLLKTNCFLWLSQSNRPKHLVYAILPSCLFSIIFVAGLAVGMEFKDKIYGGKFDWLDITATLIGGAIGQILQILLIFFIL